MAPGQLLVISFHQFFFFFSNQCLMCVCMNRQIIAQCSCQDTYYFIFHDLNLCQLWCFWRRFGDLWLQKTKMEMGLMQNLKLQNNGWCYRGLIFGLCQQLFSTLKFRKKDTTKKTSKVWFFTILGRKSFKGTVQSKKSIQPSSPPSVLMESQVKTRNPLNISRASQ